MGTGFGELLPHQRAFSEQGFDQVDRHFCGAVAHVERGVQFHQVQRAELSRVRDHFHAQLRFAVRGAAPDGGAHTGSDVGVKKVDVEADMQVGVSVHRAQRQLHRLAHAHFVDVAHVEDVEIDIVHQLLLPFVYAADADLAHPFWIDRGNGAADFDQRARPDAAQAGHRHAMDVAAWRQGVGVEVGMRIEPQNAQGLANLAAMSRDCADRADGEAMVATQKDRQVTLF